MVNKYNYEYWRNAVSRYERSIRKDREVVGTSECPFCHGSKTKPFVRQGKSQDCTYCNEDGMIENTELSALGLDSLMED